MIFAAAPTVSEPTIRVDESRATEAVDLFCGYGGATAGLIGAGLSVVMAVDLSAHAIRAHRVLHPDVPTVRGNVSNIRPRDLAGRVVWASPSCKPWSMGNQINPGPTHPEYFPLSRLVDQAALSQVLIIENVPGLIYRAEGIAELKKLDEAVGRLGKKYCVITANAQDFGLEQNRKRVFIIVGNLAAPPVLDFRPRGNPSHAPGQPSHPTVTTKTNDIRHSAALQGITNPLELTIPDYRSGRRATGNLRKMPDVGRMLVGNAVPPIMAEIVTRAALKALGSHV